MRLRDTRSRAEFAEALAKLRELMPEAGQASRALAAWVRNALIDDGAEEEDMENVRELRDIDPVVHSSWGADLIIGRASGADFLAQAARNGQPEAGAVPGCTGP